MTDFNLIGALTVAIIKADVVLTTREIVKIAEELQNTGFGTPLACPPRRTEPRKTERVTDKPRKTTMDDILESAKMDDHINIEPETPEQKPLSKKEQEFYDYITRNPDARMPSICTALNISNAMYYFLKSQLKKKGWIFSGVVENVKEYD